MGLPLAHVAGGYLVYEGVRPGGAHRPALLAAAVVFANAPDVDFLPGLLAGDPELFHRGPTHSIGAAVLLGVLATIATRVLLPSHGALRMGLLAGLAWASHLVVDAITADVMPPHGVMLLWPLSSAFFLAPRPLLDEFRADASGSIAFLRSVVSRESLPVWLQDIVLLVAVVAAVQLVRSLRGTTREALPAPEEP